MNAKKITALLLSAIMVFSLAACGETTPAEETAETVTEETGEAVTGRDAIAFAYRGDPTPRTLYGAGKLVPPGQTGVI